jgi:hypothetical protein
MKDCCPALHIDPLGLYGAFVPEKFAPWIVQRYDPFPSKINASKTPPASNDEFGKNFTDN